MQLGKTEDGFAINQYFADHPEMILGVLSTESTQYGREELTVAPVSYTHLDVYKRQVGCPGTDHSGSP